MIAYFIVGFVVLLLIGIFFLLQGAPFVPTDDTTTKQIIQLAQRYKARKVIDLGSGDGKLVIALAEKGILAYGVELNPLLVLRSRHYIKQKGLQKHAHIIWGNLWSTEVSKYDIVVLYGIKHIMRRLGDKLGEELKPGSRIITNFFVFPQWKPNERYGRVVVYKR